MADPLQQLICLLLSLLGGERLGEEIHTHLHTIVQGALDIGLEIGILIDGPQRIPPVARADHGKVHPRGGHSGPVHLLLVGGHIHPPVKAAHT